MSKLWGGGTKYITRPSRKKAVYLRVSTADTAIHLKTQRGGETSRPGARRNKTAAIQGRTSLKTIAANELAGQTERHSTKAYTAFPRPLVLGTHVPSRNTREEKGLAEDGAIEDIATIYTS
ncbi:hypothetical protein MRX96_007097 [Rhipicephalus microplus]